VDLGHVGRSEVPVPRVCWRLVPLPAIRGRPLLLAALHEPAGVPRDRPFTYLDLRPLLLPPLVILMRTQTLLASAATLSLALSLTVGLSCDKSAQSTEALAEIAKALDEPGSGWEPDEGLIVSPPVIPPPV
jgi:hypothetical protein